MRRLRRFRVEGTASFVTRLRAVVRHLCLDWRRHRDGRFRLPRAVARLPDLEQEVFRCVHLRRLTENETFHALKPLWPSLTREHLAETASRVAAALTGRRSWLFLVRRPRLQSLSGVPDGADPAETEAGLVDPRADPERDAAANESLAPLREALAPLEALPLDIVFEDADIIVINKPPGLVVHPGAGNRTGTRLNALLAHCPALQDIGDISRPGLVHRLDKDTRGLMVVPKTALAHEPLVRQFQARQVEKTYLAMVWGRFHVRTGEIDKDIGRHPSERRKMSVHARRGKPAATRWRVLKEFPGPLTLVELQPKTGRAHQLRVHLASLGHPTSATIVSGSAPFDLPGVKDALSKEEKQEYGMADKMPWLFRLFLWKFARDARKNPASIYSMMANAPDADKELMTQPGVRRAFEKMVIGAFEQGTRAAAYDWALVARPWGFSLKEIKMPVHIWQGEADTFIPVKHAQVLAEAIPDARTRFFPNEGHVLIVTHFEELLNTAIAG